MAFNVESLIDKQQNMATSISGSYGLQGQSLIRELRRRSPKKEGEGNFIGLRRSLALSDIDDPQKALNNTLEGISGSLIAEQTQYGGPYNAADWSTTVNFVDEGIDRSFLSQLDGASIGGGSLGSIVSTNPRIRIQDRISFLNSFYGEGSFPGIHSGPDAQFYKNQKFREIGFIKFTFNPTTGLATVSSIKNIEKTLDLTSSGLLGSESSVVFDLVRYTTPSGSSLDINGAGISLKLESGPTWSVFGTGAIGNLVGIDNSTKDSGDLSIFDQLEFKFVRQYSVMYRPKWFTESPAESSPFIQGSADDLNPATSPKVLLNSSGVIRPYVQRGYWNSKAYVEERWTDTEYFRLRAYSQSPTSDSIIAEDSNMRWQAPPDKIRTQVYNWGIRWDGYLRIFPGFYSFLVQTNVAVKIDMATTVTGSWETVFSTDTAIEVGENTYIANTTTDVVNDIADKYKYVYGSNPDTDWEAYIPITIRLYNGGPDKAYPDLIPPYEPDLFIKTTRLTLDRNYYNESHQFTVVEDTVNPGSWILNSDSISRIVQILSDPDASVRYFITGAGEEVYSSPINITENLSVEFSTVSLNSISVIEGVIYTLRISPSLSQEFSENLEALWKGRIASPPSPYTRYSDLTSGEYEPNLKKVPFDSRAEWWKVSEGSPYDRGKNVTKSNTPLDGFVRNEFKSELKSDALGIGLYGDGAGNYTGVPNVILGEARYTESDEKGSNYIGLRFKPNFVGEGGRIVSRALPINSVSSSDPFILGPDDLGGLNNSQTIVSQKGLTPKVKRLFISDQNIADSEEPYNKYYTFRYFDVLPSSGVTGITYYSLSEDAFYTWNGSFVEITSPSADNPADFGLPSFSQDTQWLSPFSMSVVRVGDDVNMTGGSYLTAPLVMSVERVLIGGVYKLQISTTQSSILWPNGLDLSLFDGKFIEFYPELDLAFQYLNVDTGESSSFSDVIKLTYNSDNTFNGFLSEAPRPPSARVTPFGFDKPEFSRGICYPPYAINNPLLSNIAVEEEQLYSSAPGNYDVIWGDPTRDLLDGKTLTVTEKLEFQNQDELAVESLEDFEPIEITENDYTHRLRIDVPATGGLDEDQLEYIGSGEIVKEFYYSYVKLN